RRHGELGHGSPARGTAAGRHVARDRGPELRGDRGSDELPDRHGALADFPGARGDLGEGQAPAGKPVGQTLVKSEQGGATNMENMDKRELVSALADGQLAGEAFARGVEIASTDAAAREAW